MKPETKSCQNCKKEFTIETEDFAFYEKINVPSPTWCPECRMVRRFSFQNTWNLNWRNCDKCQKKTLSVYRPEEDLIVYCQPCWWADNWDGTEYAMEYDPSRNFFEQLNELKKKTPHVALETAHTTLKNSEYTNSIGYCKDCYLLFWADYCEGVYYSSLATNLKFSVDCLRGFRSELCYDSIGMRKNYQTFFSDECSDCLNVWFSRNCYNCTNCIGCVNLRGASNCIFNVKYSKEEYEEKIKELNLESYASLQSLKKRAYEFWNTKPYREFNGNSMNLNVTGEHVYNSKNSKEMYITGNVEDCKWCQLVTVKPARECMDYSGWGNNASRIYESTVVGDNSDSIFFSCVCYADCLNLQYCIQTITGKNDFGCVNLKRKSFCILNKQYSKEEYFSLKEKIIEDMKKNPYIDKLGRKFYYGEFFPLEFSSMYYNNSNAMKFFPKTKEQALSEGYLWDDTERAMIARTLKSEYLPDNIKDTGDKILEEVIECALCKRGYKITTGELGLMRKMNLPLPHDCPKCREAERFSRVTRPTMYNRNCMKCEEPIYTPYPKEDPRIVYCVKCYQGEFA